MFSLDSKSSIFACELYAIYAALEYVHHPNNNTVENYVIISDSQAALQAISNIYTIQNQLITNIQTLIQEIKQSGKQVTFVWCPSHCGILGNEAADQAAKTSLTTPDLPTYQYLLPSDLIQNLKQTTLKEWRESFRQVSTKLSEIKLVPATWQTSFQKSRLNETMLMRLRTGHSRLSHQHLLKREQPPTCGCGELLTIKHILTTCTIYSTIRNQMFPPSERTMAAMLQDSQNQINKVFAFIQETQIKGF
ncbi:hypothetical protein M8J77_008455 [Diaphorina citri]|nr:hypothetical protein M8J77_008455 [Diaphorina citri]